MPNVVMMLKSVSKSENILGPTNIFRDWKMSIHVAAVMNKIYTKAISYHQEVCFSNWQPHFERKHPNLMAVCLHLP